jgi:hypothetical protein
MRPPRPAFPAPSGRLREYAGGIAVYCHPLKITAHISRGAFASRSTRSGKINEAQPALTHVALRSAAAAAVVLIRISTDIEINGNEQPEGISVAG